MKLMELTGIKAIKNKTPIEIMRWIKQQITDGRTNLRFLGSGSHGVALTDGTTVFKFWHRDSGYEEFYHFAKHRDYDCLPKFKSRIKHLPFGFTTKSINSFLDDYEKYKEDYEKEYDIDDLDPDSDEYRDWENAESKYINNEGFYYVKMEKLEPFSGEVKVFEDGPFRDITITVYDLIRALRDFNQYATEEMIRENIFELVKFEVGQIIDENNLETSLDDVEYEFVNDSEGIDEDLNDLIYILGELSNMTSDEGSKLDLHDGNFAMRNGKVVILDPFYNQQDLDLARSVLKLYTVHV